MQLQKEGKITVNKLQSSNYKETLQTGQPHSIDTNK